MPETRLHWGTGADLSTLGDHEADLVFTSPPYYPADLADDLLQPRRLQADFARVQARALAYAHTFSGVYREVARVLKAQRALILQIRDLRYGGFLIPLAETHRQLLAAQGLRLVTRLGWCQPYGNFQRRPTFLRAPRVGGFVADDPEEFLVFAGEKGLPARDLPVDLELPGPELVRPLWTFSSPHRAEDHPWAMPREAARRLVALFSAPGDLVVDPMMGYGTVLEEAQKLGRAVAWWELDEASFRAATGRLVR